MAFPSFAENSGCMWKKLEQEEIRKRVFDALEANKNFNRENVIGIPASYLDPRVFSSDDKILKDAPFLTTMVNNPNHIGCHTLDTSESFFTGTHELEREVIAICAESIMKAEPDSCDGYVASGGTEANIQALWIYRNYFMREFGAKPEEILILCSAHSHYSMAKGANLLNLPIRFVPVSEDTMEITESDVFRVVQEAQTAGIRYCAVVSNVMTTMFGSVDPIMAYAGALQKTGIPFKIHLDAAFGGFYYPFSNRDNPLNFANPHVTSITMDAHKMAQAPYGTGIFLIRKGFMQYANTKEASYVEGEDCTLIGSRSGANAVSIWMILSKYGPNAWFEKIFILQKRTEWLCAQLNEMSVRYYRNPFSNIVTMQADQIPHELAVSYGLVPDNHHAPSWYKIVVMDHVSIEKLEAFTHDLKKQLAESV